MNFVWLMVACSKGYILEEYHLDFIFKYIYDLCLEKEFDDYNTEEGRIPIIINSNNIVMIP